MKYGWITINITDLWNKPKYNSERVNQVLFADFVKIKDEQNGFYNVEKIDKYLGWVDKRFVSGCTFKSYQNNLPKKYVVTAKTLLTELNKIDEFTPHFLFYGTSFIGRKLKDNKIKISLPDKKSILVSSQGVSLLSQKQKSLASAVAKEAKRFLGVPYLWGGISSAGFDCSGLTQTIFARFGVTIPRDTKNQIHIGKEISKDKRQKGDLLFFKRHVAIALSHNKFIHASVGGGGVRINSFAPQDNDYREDLDKSFKTVRRLI